MAMQRRLGHTNNPDGRPEMVPTDEQRRLVTVLVGMGVPQNIICRKLREGGIDGRTLRRHFADEIEHGREELISSLKAQIVQAAMRGSVRAGTWLLERLDPEQFAPRYRQPGESAETPIPLGDVDAKVEIYLPDNHRAAADAFAPLIDVAPDDAP